MPSLVSRVALWVALVAVVGFSQQFYTTPYDLIRPVWPQTWDSTVINTYVPGAKSNSVPKNKTPADYKPNEIIPDTLNQAYWDAMNLKISPIRVNQAGYLPADNEKLIYYVGSATAFEVVDLSGKVLGTGSFTDAAASTKSSWRIVAANNAQRNMNIRYSAIGAGPTGALKKGKLPAGLPTDQRMRVKVGTDLSATFVVSNDLYSMLRDAGLKFYGVNRSGDSESWFHKASHTLDGSVGGKPGALQGGWYDCGDHLKESQTQAYAMMVLSVMAASEPDRDEDHYAYNHNETNNTDGIPDVLREAKHGADFVLRAYDYAGGVIDNMPASVGSFGADHGWWGRPEYQDLIPTSITGRGGPHERTLRLGEMGSNISGQFAATLAIVSKLYAPYDAVYAAKCLKVSEELYDFAKKLALKQITPVNNKIAAGWSSPAYNGNNEYHDDLALAAIALLYATRDTMYLYDAVENPALAKGQTKASFTGNKSGAGAFRGGWFTAGDQPTLWKAGKNTSWANAYAFTLYGFYKMILQNADSAKTYGIKTETRRKEYIEDVALTMVANLGSMSAGSGAGSITMPQGVIGWAPSTVNYDPVWFNMFTDGTWIYNRYQAGNIYEVLAYADVAKDLEEMDLIYFKRGTDWKADEMKQLGINQMNYMLGLNPWDFSMMIGVGDKNDAHPHHRGANPEGKNVPGGDYKYRPPTGTLYGGMAPSQSGDNYIDPGTMSWEEYHLSETCIDAAATFLAPTMVLAKDVDINRAPDVSVEIKYVGFDSAIVVVKQTMLGATTIQYGTSETSLTESVSSATNGVVHTFSLKPLKNGTTYFFTATSTNARSGTASTKYLVDSTKTPYSFTTLNSPPASADIQNVKVCNVSADSAEIMWYTPNGEYESKIYYDTVLTSYDKMKWSQSGDVSGVPTKFHYMKIGGLKEKTTYYYVVESNGTRRALDEAGSPLKFTTPVTQYNFAVRVHEYDWSGMTALSLNIFNNEEKPFDSLTVRLYMKGTEAQMTNCNFMMRADICQAYNEAGFNLPCENDRELRDLLRHALPVKLDDTYDPATNRFSWYFPVPLGSSTIKSSSRLRFDVMFTKGLSNPDQYGNPVCDELSAATVKKPSAADGDWSWLSHSRAAGDPVDYAGLPKESKDFGDDDLAPINPYVTVYRKDEFVWGYSPSYKEMSTKRANYKMSLGFEAPFNVSNGTYVEMDQASSTIHVKGTAEITEGGVVNAIWVNGKKLESLEGVATFNEATSKYDLDIPVKLGIGANKVDVTVFAGPSMDCAECQENGGCAFVNRNFFIQFSKGNRTASSLRVVTADGNPVASPTDPAKTQFHIMVTDKDNSKLGSVYAYVINPRKLDTLKVTLKEGATLGEFKTSSLIMAVSKDAASTSGNEIAFFGGDTLIVRYTDAEDEEDISEQTIFADPTYPVPQYALAIDANCDGITDSLKVVFSNAFAPKDVFDTLWVSMNNPITLQGDSFKVVVPQPIANLSEITVALPARTTLPSTSAPAGYVSAYLKTAGSSVMQIESANIKDGIAPVLKGVAILENPGPGRAVRMPQDTLKISFSEQVTLASNSQWPLDVVDSNGNAVDVSSITIVGKATTADNGRSWQYVVEGNTDGKLLRDGYTSTVKKGFAISDLALNAWVDSTCNEPVRITETPKPVPVRVASIKDLTGDGYADEVYLQFERKLRPKDMLDSFVVEWGNPVIYRNYQASSWSVTEEFGEHTVVNPVDSSDMVVKDTFSVITIKIPEAKRFPFGTTYGAQNGFGAVMPRLGPEGGFFDKTYAVADLCPPVIMSARKSGSMDSVGLVISEPLDTVSGGYYLERRRDSVTFEPTKAKMLNNGQGWIFIYNDDSPGALRVGDWIRLVPDDRSKVLDKAANLPGAQNPWTELKGSLAEKVRFTVKSIKPIAGILNSKDGGTPYAGFWPKTGEQFRITVVDPKSGNESRLASGSGRLNGMEKLDLYDSAQYRHLGPTFQIDVTMPSALLEVSGQHAWDFRVSIDLGLYDNLGQYINSTEYTFALSVMGRDVLSDDGTLRLMLEWVVPQDKTSPASQGNRSVGTGAYIANFDFSASATYKLKEGTTADGRPSEFKYGDRVNVSDSDRLIFGVRRP